MRQFVLWAVLAALCAEASLAQGDIPITEVSVRGVGRLGKRLVVQVDALPAWGAGGRLILARDGLPLAWLDWLETSDGGGTFVSRSDLSVARGPAALQSWVIGPEIAAALRPVWPESAGLHARIDTVGLAAKSAWIGAGAVHGIRVGDCWWGRVAGQPTVRYDVRWVASDICYCLAVPLAAGLRPRAGETVSLWPAPGLQRVGRAIGAVSFVEQTEDGQLVWVAVPPKVDVPSEPRVDFQREGSYVCGGVVERRDARFWYVRTLPGTGATDVRVGDDAVIRTVADIRARRISARVFELTPAGALINAGEIDGLSVGDVATVWRAGRHLGRVELARVQRGYSLVRARGDIVDNATTQPAQSGDQPDNPTLAGLQKLDEVRFGDPTPPPVTLGIIEHVTDGTLFTARIDEAHVASLHTPLELRRAGRTIGVALLLEAADGHALGSALARSLTVRPAAGDELIAAP